MKLSFALLLPACLGCLAGPASAISPSDLGNAVQSAQGLNDRTGPKTAADDDPVVSQVFPLRYSDARTLNIVQNPGGTPIPVKISGVVETLQNLLYQKPADTSKDSPRASSIPDIFPHRTQNAVVIVDKRSHMPFYERTIKQLDRQRPLIEVSVAIIDISSDAALAFSTEILAGANGTVSEGTGALRAGSFVTKGGELNPIVDTLNTAAGTLPGTPLSPTLVEGQTGQFSIAGTIANSTSRLISRLRTLETAGKAHVMIRPSILTLSNSEATFSDDSRLFIPVPGVNFANIYEVPVITQIKVVPRQVKEAADGSRQIQLVVIIDDSRAITSSDATLASIPMVQSGSVSSQAVVSEKGSLLVAGRYHHDETLMDARAPILGRIPVVGLLFKQKSVMKNRQQRFYLISPRIVSAEHTRLNERGEGIWDYDQTAKVAAEALEGNALLPPLEQPPMTPETLRKEEKQRNAAKRKIQTLPVKSSIPAKPSTPGNTPDPEKLPPSPVLPGEGDGLEPEPKHGKIYRLFHKTEPAKTAASQPSSPPDH